MEEEKKYRYTEQDAKAYAQQMCRSVSIRTYDADGNSDDSWRDTTPEEAALMYRAIAAALLSIMNGYEKQSAKSTAEFVICIDSPREEHINTYDSIALPIQGFLDIHEMPKANLAPCR